MASNTRSSTTCIQCELPSLWKRRCLADQPSPYGAFLGTALSFTPGNEPVKRNIKAFIADIDEDVKDCDNVIEHLETALAKARQAKQQTEAFRAAHAGLFPPIHELPVEILSEIFLLTFPKPYNVFASAKHGPWLLGKVCRHWRQVAWSSSALWTSFSIPVRPSENKQMARKRVARPLIQGALQRSPKSRVKFDVKLSKLLKSFLDPLLNASANWHDVSLEGSTQDWKPLQKLGALPALESLNIRVMLHYGRGDLAGNNTNPEQALTFFKKAPNLRRLKFAVQNVLSEDVDPSTVDFPWSQLTHLTAEVQTVAACQRLLDACPHLLSFTEVHSYRRTYVQPWDSDSPLISGVTEHTALQSVTTRNLQLLEHIKCPSLTDLSVPCSSNQTGRELELFAQRSSCAIQRLHLLLAAQSIRAQDSFSLRPFVSPFPTVECLEIDAMSKADRVPADAIESLSVISSFVPTTAKGKGTQAETALLPNMISLSLTGLRRMRMDLETSLTKLIESRMDPPLDCGVKTLEKVEIVIGSEKVPLIHGIAGPKPWAHPGANMDAGPLAGLPPNIPLAHLADFPMLATAFPFDPMMMGPPPAVYDDYMMGLLDSEDEDSEFIEDFDMDMDMPPFSFGMPEYGTANSTPPAGSAEFLGALKAFKQRGLDVRLSAFVYSQERKDISCVRYV